MSLYKQAALLVRLTVLVSQAAPVTHLANTPLVWSRKQVCGAVASELLPEFFRSSCVGEFRPECAGPQSEAQVAWKELVFADPIAGRIPAQSPAMAQFCIFPVACGSEVAWLGPVPLSVMEAFI